MKHKYLFSIIAVSLLLFLPSIFNFFSSDDWFHLRLVQIYSLREFANFFSFTPTAQSAAFYRPLSTQVFFYIFYHLFGLNPIPYHLFVLACFGYSLYLVYTFSVLLFSSDQRQKTSDLRPLLVTLFYAFSVTNFSRIYFLSAFQEIAMVIFVLLALINHLKKSSVIQIYLYFVLALFCKETAVVLPLLIITVDWYRHRFNIQKYIPYIFILLPYIYLRFFVFQSIGGDSYIWNFSLSKALNTFMWYILWSFGAPELLVDYIGSGFHILPRFFIDFRLWSYIILILTLVTVLSFVICAIYVIRSWWRQILLAIILFIICLLPVIFLPSHKFTLELGLPMISFSLLLAFFIEKRRPLAIFAVISYILLNLSMNYLTYSRHYSVSRGEMAQKVLNYFKLRFASFPPDSYVEFINDAKGYGNEFGLSKQISYAISGSDMFRVIYKDPSIKVYFQDFNDDLPVGQTRIEIGSSQFFK